MEKSRRMLKVITVMLLSMLLLLTTTACGLLYAPTPSTSVSKPNSNSSNQGGSSEVEDEKTIPVYEGMTITSSMQVAPDAVFDEEHGNKDNNGNHNGWYKGDHGDCDCDCDDDDDHDHDDDCDKDDFDKDKPFPDNNDDENIENEIESSLTVEGADREIYYASQNQDIYINIHIKNPDNFEILSFTLNGEKYSSYMFEYGSNMELIILKYNVGEASGIVEYTIDAIKYVDKTTIKDVIIEGDKTVRAGIRKENQVTATVTGLTAKISEVAFNAVIEDSDNLIEYSEGSLKAVLYNGEEIVEVKDLKVGNNSVAFKNLKTNCVYQYAIVGYYDALVDGFGMNTLCIGAFKTQAVVLFDNISISQEGLTFDFSWHSEITNRTVTSLNLYKNGKLERELAVTDRAIGELLSGAEYLLVAEYLNGDAKESIELQFATAIKTAPVLTVRKGEITATSVAFDIAVKDEDKLCEITKICFISASGSETVASDVSVRAFDNLDLFVGGKIRVEYSYDLNDGLGVKHESAELDVYFGSEGLTYVLSSDKESYTVTGIGTCTDTEVVIPNVYNGLPVTKIAGYAFEDCTFTAIRIPNSITAIESAAFIDCVALTSIVIPDSVLTLGEQAFLRCTALSSVQMSNSITVINKWTFWNCSNLTSIQLSNSLIKIGYEVFRSCGSLVSIVLPDSLTEIDSSAFQDCVSLTSLIFPDSLAKIGWGAFSGCNKLSSIVMPCSITNVAAFAFFKCDGLTTVYFKGDENQWDKNIITSECNESLINATLYFYSENKPEIDGDFWHYVDGIPTIWQNHVHTEVIDSAVAPTCTATGLTEGKHCSVCNEVLVAQTVVPALGHTEVVDRAVAPDCVNTGLTKGKHCSVCNEVLLAQTVVDALGHTEVVDEAVSATCTATGLTEGKHCSVCNEVLVAREVVPALGHTASEVVKESNFAPNCKHDGYYFSVTYCDVCKIQLTREKVIVPALGHTEVVDEAVAPTCTATGLTEGKHCSVCNEVLVAQTVVPALGHTEVIDRAVAPTCTATGLTEGKHCSVCNEVLVEQTVVPALGHTEVVDEAVAPTCTVTGLTEGKHCSVCKEVLVAQTVVDALGHTEVIDAAVEPTCTATGLTEGKHCSVCNEVLVAQTVVPALGHTEVIDAAVAPTCVNTGLTEGKHCLVCNEVLVAQTVIPALGHTYENGNKCSVCEYISTEYFIFTLLNDDTYEIKAKDVNNIPTTIIIPSVYNDKLVTVIGEEAFNACETLEELTMPNSITKICASAFNNCYSLKIIEISKNITEIEERAFWECRNLADICIPSKVTTLGSYAFLGCSSLVNLKIPASVTTIGSWCFYECSNLTIYCECGYKPSNWSYDWNPDEQPTYWYSENQPNATCTDYWHYENEEIVVWNHVEVVDLAQNPTCTQNGFTEGLHCSACETIIVEQQIIAPLGHKEVIVDAVAATCTSIGYTEARYCSVCYESLLEQQVIPMLAHTEVVDEAVAPTCTATGLTEGKHCLVCNEVLVEQEILSMVEHTEVIDSAVAPTCTATGLTEGSHCLVCGEIILEQKVLSVIEHSYNTNGKCINCGDIKAYVRGENKIYFGSYPQTSVTDSAIISSLNTKAGTLPSATYSRNWTDYGYYIEGSVKSFMWYIDIELDGDKYRGVYFTSYRPTLNTYSSNVSNSYQDNNGYTIGTAYWFKYEPISWTILRETNNQALILCDMIIDTQNYYSSSADRMAGDLSTVYSNNYAHSTIRNWLNYDFYNTAFSELQKQVVATTTVDNSVYSTGLSSNQYACANTSDKVFVLSLRELVNNDYGFSSSNTSFDAGRQKMATDYALIQGLCVETAIENNLACGYWWTRSPHTNANTKCIAVCHDGVLRIGDTYRADVGVVPALVINLV